MSMVKIKLPNGKVVEISSLPGAKGADGKNGKDGVDGKSAYELAVAEGFEGDLGEWLASLKGEAGADGADGHTPQKGVDYLTEGEIAESLEAAIAYTDEKTAQVVASIGTSTKDDVIVYDVESDEGVYNYAVITGNYNVTTGAFYSAKTQSRSTEKIPVLPNEQYTIEGTCTGAYALFSEFNENQDWIASYGTNQLGKYTFSSDNGYSPYIYTVPEGVAYVAFSSDNAQSVPLKVIGPVSCLRKIDEVIADVVNPLKTDIEETQQSVGETKQRVEGEVQKTSDAIGETTYLEDVTSTLTLETGVIDRTYGKIITVDKGKATQPFEVSSGEVYHVWGQYSTGNCLIAWYDDDKSFINAVYVTESGVVTKVAENEVYTVPEIVADTSGNERKVAYMACATNNNGDYPLKVKKEVARYNNIQDDISGAVEDLSAIKLDKVLVSPNGSEWALTISDDGTLKATKLRAHGADVVTTLTLPNNLAAGTYALRYENANGALGDYADICSLEITTAGEGVTYNGFIAENCAPEGTTSIGVYDSADNRVDGIELGFLENKYSDRLYSFAAISDIHIGVSDGEEDFTNAVEYFENEKDIEFVTICGDMVNSSGSVEQLTTYQSIARGATKPIYVVTGNHEANEYNEGEDFDDIKGYFAQEKYPNINQKLYYSFTHNNDVFIMVGTHSFPAYNTTFTLEELQWLYETLEKNRNRRCFLYTHYYPLDGSGDALGLYNLSGFEKSIGQAFLSLLRHYKNVIYFHGHTHAAFSVQELNAMNTIDRIYGRYSINIPSLTWPRVPNEGLTDYNKLTQAGEGYIVDVYENGIALRGRDFENGAFLPIGSYYLDTVIQKIEANSYKDPTGTLTTPIA